VVLVIRIEANWVSLIEFKGLLMHNWIARVVRFPKQFWMSWQIEQAFDRVAKKDDEGALRLIDAYVNKYGDNSFELCLLRGHCLKKAQKTKEAADAFGRARSIILSLDDLSQADRDYLIQYGVSHFRDCWELSPFRREEVNPHRDFSRVSKRYLEKFPVSFE
jgi:hypothetical protein